MGRMSLNDETQGFTAPDKHAKEIIATIVENKASTEDELLAQFRVMEEQQKRHFADLGLLSVIYKVDFTAQ
jgi:hypothetical protein